MSFLAVFLASLAAGAVLLIAGMLVLPPLMRGIGNRMMRIMIRDVYTGNLFGMVSVARRLTLQGTGETLLRAGSQGKAIQRPMGSPLHFSPWEDLLFTPAQLGRQPLLASEKTDLSVVIGPRAKRPLKVDIPLLVTGMSYGGALTGKAKVALARAANRVGTATNSGEAFLASERREAERLIVQFHRGTWPKSPQNQPQLLAAADAIEIQVGQGAQAGAPIRTAAENVDKNMRSAYGLEPGKDALIDGRFKEVDSPEDLRTLIDRLHEEYPVPVGVKLAAADTIEDDIERLMDAKPDFICIDGAEGGTHGGPIILQDDFGLPTMHAIARADKHLRDLGLRDGVTLIAAGGLHSPGICLKAIALGADACYLGTTLMLAIASDQVIQALPWEPPYSLFLETGSRKGSFSVEEGAQRAGDFLQSSAQELDFGLRALGKSAVAEVSREDMIALTPEASRLTGCRMPYGPEHKAPRTEEQGPRYAPPAWEEQPQQERRPLH
ncbi:MAG: FMN-binding glutamate synthase family protein [Thermaerobacter sp.]|nr:FMN-binding glutamate synthase family protein [Thermaerobacter sp.]